MSSFFILFLNITLLSYNFEQAYINLLCSDHNPKHKYPIMGRKRSVTSQHYYTTYTFSKALEILHSFSSPSTQHKVLPHSILLSIDCFLSIASPVQSTILILISRCVWTRFGLKQCNWKQHWQPPAVHNVNIMHIGGRPHVYPDAGPEPEEQWADEVAETEVDAPPPRPSSLVIEAPPPAPAPAPSPGAGAAAPRRDSQVTDQGYFDVKFYHNKLW